jgi:FrmR/RcnR family transcriptional regulator, repressor of frmRAB operon
MTDKVGGNQTLLARVRCIRGQVDAIEQSLESEANCDTVIAQLAAVRRNTMDLMAKVIEDHVQALTVDRKLFPEDVARQVLDVVRSCLK